MYKIILKTKLRILYLEFNVSKINLQFNIDLQFTYTQ